MKLTHRPVRGSYGLSWGLLLGTHHEPTNHRLRVRLRLPSMRSTQSPARRTRGTIRIPRRRARERPQESLEGCRVGTLPCALENPSGRALGGYSDFRKVARLGLQAGGMLG